MSVQMLPVVLGVAAGCTDVIGFLGLNGPFTAHIMPLGAENLTQAASDRACGTHVTLRVEQVRNLKRCLGPECRHYRQ